MPKQREPIGYEPDWIERARHLAEIVHDEQVDKAGRPYIEHPMRVASYVHITSIWLDLSPEEQYDAIVAAWLHDVIEDSGGRITEQDLKNRGYADRVVEAVVLLTREKGKPKDDPEYYRRILEHRVARAVKWADMIDNTDPYRLNQIHGPVANRLIADYDKGAACLNLSPTPTGWWNRMDRIRQLRRIRPVDSPILRL